MTLNSVPLLLAAGLALVFLIYRQFQVRPPGGWRRATLIPLGLIGWGVINATHLSSVSVVVVTISATGVGLGLILGVARGYATDIWRDPDGMVLQKGTIALAILWALSLAVRIGLSVIGGARGINQTEAYAEIPLFFGVTLAAQNATISARLRAGGPPASGRRAASGPVAPFRRDRHDDAGGVHRTHGNRLGSDENRGPAWAFRLPHGRTGRP